MIFDSILDTIGRTPVVRVQRLAPAGVTMYVKLEAFNPMSSVKDRLALAIILDVARGTRFPAQPEPVAFRIPLALHKQGGPP